MSFYLNPRRVNDQWQYDEATKLGKTDPAMEIADSQWFRFSLELTGQDLGGAVGEFTVVPRVVDRVGNQAEFELEPLVVRVANKEAQAMQEPDRPKSYEIRLKVTVNRNRAVSGEPEFVVNDGAKSVQKIGARDDYVYAIRDLQPGEYKIEASYQAPTGRARTGTLTIKIGPQETNPIIRRVLKLE